MNEILKQLGISDKEARVYLAALELGTASAKEISIKAGIQRTHFYDLSRQLIEMGLLRQVAEGKKAMFTATDPEMLVSLQQQKARELERILPQLKAIQNNSEEKPKISYYQGVAGINQINADTLNYKTEIVAFTTPRFASIKDKKFGEEYIKNRCKSGNKVRVIGEMSTELMALKQRDGQDLRETRLLPKDTFSSEIEIGVYGHKTCIIDYKNEFGFIVEGKEIAKTLKNIFEIVWQSGKIVS